LLEHDTGGHPIIALVVDPDPVRMASSPLGAFTTVPATAEGLRELALDLSQRAGKPLTEAAAVEFSAALLADIRSVGQTRPRDVELNFVFPEGAYRQPFAPTGDMEWPAAINGIVD